MTEVEVSGGRRCESGDGRRWYRVGIRPDAIGRIRSDESIVVPGVFAQRHHLVVRLDQASATGV
jgi:hypothetical protein